jgi:nucleoid-associated protein YgaU
MNFKQVTSNVFFEKHGDKDHYNKEKGETTKTKGRKTSWDLPGWGSIFPKLISRT